MIRVEIDLMEIPTSVMLDNTFLNAYMCSKLEDAGIPILGGPLLPRVDFSKGSLTAWDDWWSKKRIFLWKSEMEGEL